jgi:hypothetical protein
VGPAARAVLDEVDELRSRLGLRVVVWDERLSTVEAERRLRAVGVKGKARRRVVDQVAATVILQAWLDAGQPPSAGPGDLGPGGGESGTAGTGRAGSVGRGESGGAGQPRGPGEAGA